MRKRGILVLLLVFIMILLMPKEVLSVCSDVPDTTPEHRDGKNFYLKGTCTDPFNPEMEGEDYCIGIGFIKEHWCVQCNPTVCNEDEFPCDFGCNSAKAACYKSIAELNGGSPPTSGNWCYDGDGPDWRDIHPSDRGKFAERININQVSYCIDHNSRVLANLDSCDGSTVLDWYCNDDMHCVRHSQSCPAGCTNGYCTPVAERKALCINPDDAYTGVSDICEFVTLDICCPYSNAVDRSDCRTRYWDEFGGLADLCTQVCCCELSFDDDNNRIITANADLFKAECTGDYLKESTWAGECNDENCEDLEDELFSGVEPPATTGGGNIQEGQACNLNRNGCASGLVCRPDLNDPNKNYCCMEGSCVIDNICVIETTQGTKAGSNQEYVCTDSQWVASTKSGGGSGGGGCFNSNNVRSRDLGIAFIPFAFIALFAARKIKKK